MKLSIIITFNIEIHSLSGIKQISIDHYFRYKKNTHLLNVNSIFQDRTETGIN